MKRLLLALVLLCMAFPATAQVNQLTILTPLSPAHRLPFDTTSIRITSSFSDATRAVRVVCTVSCHIQMGVSGANPIAFTGGTTSSIFLAPNVAEYIAVDPNGKAAVIGVNASGILFIQEFGR